MISLCTSSLDRQQSFLDILCSSVIKTSKLISEVVVNNPNRGSDWNYEESVFSDREIKLRFIGGNELNANTVGGGNGGSGLAGCAQHGIGITNAVFNATNDLVLICDPDIFFYTPVEELFYNLMCKHELNIVGISHPAAITEAFMYYPNVMCTLVRKSDIFNPDFLRVENLHDQHYLSIYVTDVSKLPFLSLMPGEVTGRNYPKPDGHYETGCNLCLLGEERNWKWFSFQTGDLNSYSTQYCRGNVKISKLPKQRLLYHQVNSAGIERNLIVPFNAAWDKFCSEEEN